MRTIIIILLCLLIPAICSALSISEIMFNPEGSDTGREWILLDANGTGCTAISNYKLFESGTSHTIYEYNFSEYNQTCNKIIICNDLDKFLADYPELDFNKYKIYRSSFSLSNTGELIEILSVDGIIDEIDYSEITTNLTILEGYSLVKINGVWGSSNNIGGTLIEEIQTNISAYNETNNATNNDTYNITNTTNTTKTNTTSENITTNTCNASIYVVLKENRTVFDNENPIKFYNKIIFNDSDNKQNYSIEYWVEDLFGNIMKNKISTSNEDEKSYTPKIDEHEKTLIIKNILKNTTCNRSKENDEKIIVIRNNNYVQQKCPECSCSTKCEKCVCNDKVSSKECVPNTVIKTVNNCTTSKTSSKSVDKTANASIANEGAKMPEQDNNLTAKSQNQPINNSKNAGQVTGMVLYESPNYKNRFYAIIGLVILGLAGVTITVYRIKHAKIEAR